MDNHPNEQANPQPPSVKEERKKAARAAREARAVDAAQQQLAAFSLEPAAPASCRRALCFEPEH